MNIIFCNRIRGCRLTKYPGPFVCILLIMEAQHVLRNGIGIEENICNTVQLTRTMAVENYACFYQKYKRSYFYKFCFLVCFANDDDENLFMFCLRENKGTKNTRKKSKEMFIRTTK